MQIFLRLLTVGYGEQLVAIGEPPVSRQPYSVLPLVMFYLYFLFYALQGMHEGKRSPELIFLSLFFMVTSGSSEDPFHLTFLTSLKTGRKLFMFHIQKLKYFCQCSCTQAESFFPYVRWLLAYLHLFSGMNTFENPGQDTFGCIGDS